MMTSTLHHIKVSLRLALLASIFSYPLFQSEVLYGAEVITQITCQLPSRSVQALSPASDHADGIEESKKELFLGASFAKELDFYRAITAYKRARFLAAASRNEANIEQADYGLALAYYLGGKYGNVVEVFEGGSLGNISPGHKYYNSLLPILFDSYLRQKQYEKASNVLYFSTQISPELGKSLAEYKCIATGEAMEGKSRDPINGTISSSDFGEPSKRLYAEFNKVHKSPFKAGLYNALLPGAGYLYVGQVQSGITSFLLNAVFIAASIKFFQDGQTAAGIITTGFEVGWYAGGIRGAAIAAKEYNERFYTRRAKEILLENRLFPVLLIDVGF